jgi:serine/threonine protein kinase
VVKYYFCRIQYYHIHVNKHLKANCSQIITNAGNAHQDKHDVPTNMDSMIVVKSNAAGRDTAKSGIVTCFYSTDVELKVGPQCQDDVQGEVSPFPSGERLSKDSVLFGRQYSNIYDKYQFDPRILDAGLHGSVRRCVDRSTGKKYAVKSIRKDNLHVRPHRLLREVTLLEEMLHTSIICLIEIIEDKDYMHIVTELCNGGMLFDRIVKESSDTNNDNPCFAEDKAARVIHQILIALQYMHERGIVHRDIKPKNVLFETADEDLTMKIINFGLSRSHDDRVDLPMSSIVGTPHYIAPEVLLGKYDKACNLWSVGIVAYILLCGYPPFNGVTDHQTQESVLLGWYKFHAMAWDVISIQAIDFVRGLLQIDPRQRMTTQQALMHPWIVKHVIHANDTSIRREEPPTPSRSVSCATMPMTLTVDNDDAAKRRLMSAFIQRASSEQWL